MKKIEFDIAMKVLDRYYISSDLVDSIKIAYDEGNKNVVIEGIFSPVFTEKILSRKISREYHKYPYVKRILINTSDELLYFCHSFRNYLFESAGIGTIDVLNYMKDEYKVRLLKYINFSISNKTWILNNNISVENYYNTLYKTPKYLKKLLSDFDNLVNPFLSNKTTNSENIKEVKMIDDKCGFYIIKKDNYIMKCSRSLKGFGYSLYLNINDDLLNVKHYFDGNEKIRIESINEKIRIIYNLTNQTIYINSKDEKYTENDIRILCDIITNVIERLSTNQDILNIDNDINRIKLYRKIR